MIKPRDEADALGNEDGSPGCPASRRAGPGAIATPGMDGRAVSEWVNPARATSGATDRAEIPVAFSFEA
jgi:hypothetical protein